MKFGCMKLNGNVQTCRDLTNAGDRKWQNHREFSGEVGCRDIPTIFMQQSDFLTPFIAAYNVLYGFEAYTSQDFHGS